jgi:hypothetical protein
MLCDDGLPWCRRLSLYLPLSGVQSTAATDEAHEVRPAPIRLGIEDYCFGQDRWTSILGVGVRKNGDGVPDKPAFCHIRNSFQPGEDYAKSFRCSLSMFV